MINITELPLKIPISLCLPAECGSESYWTAITDEFTSILNSAVINLKKTTDFDTLYAKVPNNTADTRLMRQLAGLVTNDTLL